MNRLVLRIYFSSLITIVMLGACIKTSLDTVDDETPTYGFELNEERIAIVNEISNIFQNELEQAIKKNETKSNTFDVKAFSISVTDNFKKSIN